MRRAERLFRTSGVTDQATVPGCALTFEETIWVGKSVARWYPITLIPRTPMAPR